jgi:hypothetical protein
MAKSPAWTRKEGKAAKGGLNAKGRASYNKANPTAWTRKEVRQKGGLNAKGRASDNKANPKSRGLKPHSQKVAHVRRLSVLE